MHNIGWKSILAVLAIVGVVSAAGAGRKPDGGIMIYVTEGAYDDVRFELRDAIISRGFKIDYNGHIADMLKRTAKDVGAEKSVYRHAEFFTFCSSIVSRRVIESDPRTLGFCPYTLFIYELVQQPGRIRVGYRRPALIGSAETKKLLTEINKLLDGIARAAIQ